MVSLSVRLQRVPPKIFLGIVMIEPSYLQRKGW